MIHQLGLLTPFPNKGLVPQKYNNYNLINILNEMWYTKTAFACYDYGKWIYGALPTIFLCVREVKAFQIDFISLCIDYNSQQRRKEEMHVFYWILSFRL